MEGLILLCSIGEKANPKNVRKGFGFAINREQGLSHLESEYKELIEAVSEGDDDNFNEELVDVLSVLLHIAFVEGIDDEVEKMAICKCLYRYDFTEAVEAAYLSNPLNMYFQLFKEINDKIKVIGREDKEGWRKLLTL